MKNKILNLINHEYFWIYFSLFGIVIQFITYMLTNDTYLSFISGFAGVLSVVLCSERKLSFYFWSFLQIITFFYLSYQERLYANMVEYVFYFITALVGIFIWFKNKKIEDGCVESKSLTKKWNYIFSIVTAIIVTTITIILSTITDDTMPFLDSITTVSAFMAQFLMIFCYKEQWYYWMVVNIGSIVMWLIIGNYCMVAQFIFWTLNCFYGYYKWK